MSEANQKKDSDILTMVATIVFTISWFYFKNVGRAILRRKTWTSEFILITSMYVITLISLSLSTWKSPLILLHHYLPTYFIEKPIFWILIHIKEPYLTLILALLPVTLYLFVIGLIDTIKYKKVQKAFDHLGLKTSTGLTPIVKAIYDGEDGKKKIVLQGTGFDINEIKNKKGNIESSLNAIVQEIRVAPNHRQLFEIFVAEKELKTLISFEDLALRLTKPYTFLVGETLNGLICGDLCELHHVIIAGATGGGKSVFFKQMLVGLLKSSNHIQLYLIDLKRGVEMRIFESLNNVEIMKETVDAIAVLESIVKEMERRFVYLENNNYTEIVPARDKMDRIVIGIDEASVLFTIEKHSKLTKQYAELARELTDKIAKLGRAAGIHLVLATQKVVKETIDTRVQSNINARMVFRLNTVASSMTVLGNKKAAELPQIKGRAIWSVGSEDNVVQVPYLSPEEMNDELVELQSKFNSKKKTFFGPMIKIDGPVKKKKSGFTDKEDEETNTAVKGVI